MNDSRNNFNTTPPLRQDASLRRTSLLIQELHCLDQNNSKGCHIFLNLQGDGGNQFILNDHSANRH